MSLEAHQFINQTSNEVEWFTPIEIIEAATECMGFIDLDPASCERANIAIGAQNYFTKEDDGLIKPWDARTVWLNHPFGRKTTPLWINKLFHEFDFEHFDQACVITYAATSEKWFRPLLNHPQCFIHGRTNYIARETMLPAKGVSKGSVVTYLGDRTGDFAKAFEKLGTVKVKWTEYL